MAKISNTAGASNIWLGSHKNARQTVLYVPGSLTAEKPGLLFLESIDGSANAGGLFLWADQANNLRFASVAPADEDADGNILATSHTTNLSVTMNNLGTTAVNADILPGTDSDVELGSTSKYWKELWVDKIYVGSSATIAYGAADRIDFVGDEYHGVDSAGATVTWYGTEGSSYMKWDDTYNTNQGSLALTDGAHVLWGDGADILMDWDGTDFNVDCKDTNKSFMFGEAVNMDVVFKSQSSAGNDAAWDASTATLQLSDASKLHFGDATILTQTDGFWLTFVSGDTPSTLTLDAKNADDLFRVGKTNVTNVQFDGAGSDIIWDGSQDAYIFQDGAELGFGTDIDIYMRYDGGNDTLDIGQTSDGTGAIDIIDTPVIMTGADAAGTLLTILGADAGNTDTVSIQHTGTEAGLKIEVLDTDGLGLEVLTEASQTTKLVLIDGDTGGWIGVANTGMVHIQNDVALAATTASALLIDVGTTKPINSALGYCFRIDDDSDAVTVGPAWTALIDSENNCALSIIAQNVPDYKNALRVAGTLLTGQQSEGVTAYLSTAINGTTDGAAYGVGIWTDVGAAAAPAGHIRALDVGVYSASGATWTSGAAYGLSVSMHLDASSGADAIYPMRFNSDGQAVTAWFHAASAASVAFTPGNPGTADDGYITVAIAGGTYRIPLVAV